MLKGPFHFEQDEFKSFGFTVLVLTLVIFFFKWRNTDFTLFIGINWFILTLIIVLTLTSIARLLQKYVAYKKGYIAKFEGSWKAAAITLSLSFFSFGFIPILAPGKMNLEPVERLRIGHNQQGIRWKDMSTVSLVSILTYVIFVMGLKLLATSAEGVVIDHIFLVSLLLALFSVLPLPSYEGINIFANSRLIYVFLLTFVIAYSVIIWFTNLYTVIIPILTAILLTGLFIFKVDKPF